MTFTCTCNVHQKSKGQLYWTFDRSDPIRWSGVRGFTGNGGCSCDEAPHLHPWNRHLNRQNVLDLCFKQVGCAAIRGRCFFAGLRLGVSNFRLLPCFYSGPVPEMEAICLCCGPVSVPCVGLRFHEERFSRHQITFAGFLNSSGAGSSELNHLIFVFVKGVGEDLKVFLIGIDVGTASTKAMAVCPEGRTVCIAQERYGIVSRRANCAEQDPEIWWQAVKTALRQVIAKPVSSFQGNKSNLQQSA